MKKLIIAAAIVCAAALSQAATASWNTGALQTVDADGKWTTTALYGSGAKITAMAYLYADQACTELLASGAGGAIGPTSAVSGKFYSSGTTQATLSNSTTYYVKLVMSGDFGNGDTQEFLVTDAFAYTLPDKGNGSVSFTTLGAIDTSSSKAQWSAVPEPTSGLLLLLGVAGLALRRRRA